MLFIHYKIVLTPPVGKNLNKMKQLIERNLDLSKKYDIVGTFYLKDDNFSVCQDCGRVIKKVAIIKCNETEYHIGFDCLEKIMLTNKILSNIFELETYKDGIATMIKISNYITKNGYKDIKLSEYNNQFCIAIKAHDYYKMFRTAITNLESVELFIKTNYKN